MNKTHEPHVERVELIAPNKELLLLTEEVLKQHKKIIEINAMIIEALARPMVKYNE